ncbi:MAG TPA: type II toxin-antitoxin system RelE/ParE family toxin [Opitutaceae bacterium]|nr:type II toxin-antitoxin system RelE/ParE family toxin [Opitutaceae bacterium]
MKIRIVAEAERELTEAISGYEEIETGLGSRLKEEVRAAIAWIGEHPTLPRPRLNGYRRVNLRVFRFFIAYAIVDDTIWILAVAHGRRRPEFWIERKSRIE